MTDDLPQLVAPIGIIAIAKAWKRWSLEPGFPFKPNHCVNGTRVVTLALERLGVPAEPVSVRFTIFNSLAWRLYRKGVDVAHWPPDAWSVGVGPGTKGPNPDGWDGHLMAEGEAWTLDISARQFNRPGLIHVPGPNILPRLPDDHLVEMSDNAGQVMVVGRWPENNGWRHAPGWKRLHAAEVEELLRRTQRFLAERN